LKNIPYGRKKCGQNPSRSWVFLGSIDCSQSNLSTWGFKAAELWWVHVLGSKQNALWLCTCLLEKGFSDLSIWPFLLLSFTASNRVVLLWSCPFQLQKENCVVSTVMHRKNNRTGCYRMLFSFATNKGGKNHTYRQHQETCKHSKDLKRQLWKPNKEHPNKLKFALCHC